MSERQAIDGARWEWRGRPVSWSWMHREAARALGMRAGFTTGEDDITTVSIVDPTTGERQEFAAWSTIESDALICVYVGMLPPAELWRVRRDPRGAEGRFLAWMESEHLGDLGEANTGRIEAISVLLKILAGVSDADFRLAKSDDRAEASVSRFPASTPSGEEDEAGAPGTFRCCNE